MVGIRRILVTIAVIPVALFMGLFAISAAVNGFDEALELTFSAPRNLFCSVMPFCDVNDGEANIVDTQEIWTRIHERALLDTGKYETRRDWKAERTTWPVTHSMRMRATMHVTMGVNLDNLLPEDIVVEEDSQSVTITLPPTQPIECFLTDIEYYDESCLLICGDLEQDLQEKARQNVLDSDELQLALDDAYQQAESVVSGLIAPAAEGYTIQFVQSAVSPPPIESGSCN